ncbi:MAG: hypothetical protein K6E72_11660 [Saccharofermentans sp.]|nr:hypothetical protein [Saccharofermentans sp.]
MIYGIINARSSDGYVVAILRTVIDIGKMYAGGNRYEEFSIIVGNSIGWSIAFWAVHFFAYYALVSTVLIFLGKDAVRKLRAFILHIRDIEVIYGIDDEALLFGKKLSENKDIAVVFVGEALTKEAAIRQMGGVLYSDVAALSASVKFIKRLAVKKEKGSVRLNAVSDDADANLSFALKFVDSLKKCGVLPKQSALVLLGKDEEEGVNLLANKDKYGYGSVKLFERSELAARLLFQKFPVCDRIEFDEKALAKKNVDCIIVGFGKIGQEVLRKLVANGQFEGSSFHLKVYDPDIEKLNGIFKMKYAGMLNAYNIEFEDRDIRSVEAVKYIMEKASELTYIVIAMSDEKKGREIAHGITDILEHNESVLPVFQCGQSKVIAYYYSKESEKYSIFDADILYHGQMDKLAVLINHDYRGEDGDVETQWAECDYYSRMSCRASADYLSALFRRLNISGKDIDEKTLDNLGKTEHLRWNAFHFSMGYSLMSDEDMKEREKMFKTDPSVRVTRDAKRKLHACLVPWDELDALSDFENKLTGKNIDYKKMDCDNIITVKELMDKGSLQLTEPSKKRIPLFFG